MKLKKISLLLGAFALLAVIAASNCTGKKKEPGTGGTTASSVVKPVPLPSVVPGFKFPEDATVINGWINDAKFAPTNYDSASIYKHAWGIWAGLTSPTQEEYAGDKLRVYETWMGLNEIRDLVIDSNTKGGCAGTEAKRKFGRAPLTRPSQFGHALKFSKVSRAQAGSFLAVTAGKSKPATPLFQDAVNQWVTVSYDPNAACFATSNQIFRTSVINKYYNAGGLGAIPQFPNSSITIKPTYLVYDTATSLLRMPVWITAPQPANANFFGAANSFVFIDRTNTQPAGKVAVPVDSTASDPAKIAAATINLSDFISLKVDQQMATYMNQQDSIQGLNVSTGGQAVAGQIAVLVGMHVTTKEITNWTWQSYYWTPNRDNPGTPSSPLAASLRPKEITGAAANYACVAAYVMLTPNNAPNASANGPMFGYNPYLEGGFGPGVFTFANTYNKSYQYGVQTNCMSCHALAIADTTTNVGRYTTDQTINLQDTLYFGKQVSLDFAWSIQTALVYDQTPYWIKK